MSDRQASSFEATGFKWLYDRQLMETVTLTIDGRQSRSRRARPSCRPRSKPASRFPTTAITPASASTDRAASASSRSRRCRSCRRRARRRRPRAWWCTTQTPDVVDGPRQRVRVPADQPPARLPGVRQGRRVPAAGLLVHASGPNESRMEFPRRVFDGEGVKADVDFGPTLMLNRNRCILCTRCVRFMREVDGDAQINIIDRGYGSEIATFQRGGRPLAAVRQPDGRLPGRRDHDARLPLQVAARGTTRTRSTRSARSARRAATRPRG